MLFLVNTLHGCNFIYIDGAICVWQADTWAQPQRAGVELRRYSGVFFLRDRMNQEMHGDISTYLPVMRATPTVALITTLLSTVWVKGETEDIDASILSLTHGGQGFGEIRVFQCFLFLLQALIGPSHPWSTTLKSGYTQHTAEGGGCLFFKDIPQY